MKAETQAISEVKFSCPECGSVEHSAAHLQAGHAFGPWYCDECGLGITGVADGMGGAEIEVYAKNRKVRTLVLLRLGADLAEPVHIAVQGMKFTIDGQLPDDAQEQDAFLYNEHTCPENWLHLPIKQGSDPDPHGVFVHQETVAWPAELEEITDIESMDQWRQYFPSLRARQASKAI